MHCSPPPSRGVALVTLPIRLIRPTHAPTLLTTLFFFLSSRQVLKAVVAQYNAEQLITQREKVSMQVRDALTSRAKEFHILLEDVAITDLKFGKEFTAAIESKQVAEQDAERARLLVLKSEEEKKASVIKAEALVSQALEASPALIELRRIEAAKDIAETLSRSRNLTYLPSGGQNLLLSVGSN